MRTLTKLCVCYSPLTSIKKKKKKKNRKKEKEEWTQ